MHAKDSSHWAMATFDTAGGAMLALSCLFTGLGAVGLVLRLGQCPGQLQLLANGCVAMVAAVTACLTTALVTGKLVTGRRTSGSQ
jgi:hypothetical protein